MTLRLLRAPLLVVCLIAGLTACRGTSPTETTTEATTEAKGQAQTKDEAPVDSACGHAMTQLAGLEAGLVGASMTLAHAQRVWLDADAGGHTSLREWVAGVDLGLGRVAEGEPIDVEHIDALLQTAQSEPGGGRELAEIVGRLRALSLLELRRLLAEIAEGRGDASAQWENARCLWDGAIRPLAAYIDSLPGLGGEEWERDLSEVLDQGAAQLDELPAMKIVKQRIEKGSYAVLHRSILTAAESRSGVRAGFALGLLVGLEDRVADRNGPGLRRIQAMLAGETSAIDGDLIAREFAVAFAKRARKYCDRALVTGVLATPEAIAETWEGIVYTEIILPGMTQTLAGEGFDPDAYAASWRAYLDALRSDDPDTAAALSAELVEWNCAYQDAIGIMECSASSNEAE